MSSNDAVKDDAAEAGVEPGTLRAETAGVRLPFRRAVGFDTRTAVILLVVFGAVRMALVFQANATGSYQAVSLVFIAMALLPWVLLTRDGRRRIGIVRPRRRRWLLPAALAGMACCLATAGLVMLLWGHSASNPFVYIAGTYTVPGTLSDTDRLIYFAVFAGIGMLFSPIGEELLYRGLAHEGLAARIGSRRAALLEAGAFATVHLAHFGIVYSAGTWAFLPLPAALWVGSMFLAALVFNAFRVLTGSILGAICAHASFNLAMNFVIFYGLGLF